MDFAKALSYPLQDKSKILQSGVYVMLPPIIGLIAFFGYSLDIIRMVAVGEDEELPDWGNYGDYFKRGLISIIAFLVYILPALLISQIGGTQNNGGEIFAVIVVIPLYFLFLVALLRYAAEERIESFIEIQKNTEILYEHAGALVGTFAVVFFLNFVPIIATIILSIGIVTVCFAGVVQAFVYIVDAHLLGSLVRRLNLELPKEQIFFPISNSQETPMQIKHEVETLPLEESSEPQHNDMPQISANPHVALDLEHAIVY